MRDDQGIREDAALSRFEPGLALEARPSPMGFEYGPGVFGPEPELRRLDSIRRSLLDPDCSGPDPVYAIAMDVGREEHRRALEERSLLFGVVTYAAGSLGWEPVRSQGHVHKVARHSGWSPPELYEIWSGRAVVNMQERAADDPGRCIAIEAGPGEVVVVPPGWAHATVSADPRSPMTFGAWCDREYGFEYDAVRARGGLAHYPILTVDDGIDWQPNPRYAPAPLMVRGAREYPELGLEPGIPVYDLFARDPERVQWISDPARLAHLWEAFQP